MKDSKQKQYFDIKSPTEPDATSRPVINSEPVQADPMVSAHSVPETEPEKDKPSTVVVTEPEKDESSEVAVTESEEKDQPTKVAVSEEALEDDLPSDSGLGVLHEEPGSFAVAVKSKQDEPNSKDKEADDKPADEEKGSDKEPADKPADEEKGSDKEPAEDSESTEPTETSTEPETKEHEVHPSDFGSSGTNDTKPSSPEHAPKVEEPLNTGDYQPAAAVDPFPLKNTFTENLGLKIVLLALVVVLLGVISFIAFKFKSGQ